MRHRKTSETGYETRKLPGFRRIFMKNQGKIMKIGWKMHLAQELLYLQVRPYGTREAPEGENNQTKAFEKRYLKSALRATNYFIEGREDRQKKDKTGKRKDKGQKTKKQAGFSQNKQQKEKANTEEKRKQSTVHCETKEKNQV